MMQEFIQSLFVTHWPWFAVAAILMIVGQFLTLSVFTRKRAYADHGKGVRAYIIESIFWWGRESLMLQPIALGAFIGFHWPDPIGAGWDAKTSMVYFGSAGVMSLFLWVLARSRAKKKGIKLKLPGRDTEPPKEA